MKNVTNRLTAAAGAIIILTAAVLLSCGEGSKDLGPAFTGSQLDAYVAIKGHTYDAFNNPLPDVNVERYCASHDPPIFLGSTAVDAFAYYEIQTEDPWTEHNGHTLHGIATKEGFYDDHQYIYDFRWAGIPYERDFHLTQQIYK